jgi:hypothetical protein
MVKFQRSVKADMPVVRTGNHREMPQPSGPPLGGWGRGFGALGTRKAVHEKGRPAGNGTAAVSLPGNDVPGGTGMMTPAEYVKLSAYYGTLAETASDAQSRNQLETLAESYITLAKSLVADSTLDFGTLGAHPRQPYARRNRRALTDVDQWRCPNQHSRQCRTKLGNWQGNEIDRQAFIHTSHNSP